MTDLLVAGRVGRPHGLEGFFHVVDAAAALLPVGASVHVDERRTEILGRKGTDEHPILRVGLARDRSRAESLRGATLRIARSAAPALGENEYWPEELVGCAVFVAGTEERTLGRVSRMLGYPSCELLELDDEATTLIPLVRDAVRRVDIAARRIEVDGPFLGLDV